MLFRNSAFATKTLTSIGGFPSTMGQYVVDCTNSIEEYRENIIETNLVHYRYFLCAIVLWIPSLQWNIPGGNTFDTGNLIHLHKSCGLSVPAFMLLAAATLSTQGTSIWRDCQYDRGFGFRIVTLVMWIDSALCLLNHRMTSGRYSLIWNR